MTAARFFSSGDCPRRFPIVMILNFFYPSVILFHTCNLKEMENTMVRNRNKNHATYQTIVV